MNWWILSNIEFTCGFSVVAQLALIPYYFTIRSFLNALPRKSFTRSYTIIVGQRYLHTYVCSTMFAIVAACLSLYCNISNHPVARSIIVKNFSMRGS